MEVSVTINTTLDNIAGMLCSALEGGSNYWYVVDEFIEPPELAEGLAKDWHDFRHITYPLSPGGALIILDKEDGMARYRFDLEAVRRGLLAMAEKEPRHFGDFIGNNGDATTGDVFLQLCLFGEVRYG